MKGDLLEFTMIVLAIVFSLTALAEQNFKIGMVICLSGECAPDGYSTLEGAQIAADEINKIGGILGKQIEFVVQDTAEAVSGKGAITAFRQLRLDKEIHYFIGPSWGTGGLALAPVVSKEGVIITSPSLGVREFHQAGDNIFNTRGIDEMPTRKAAKLAINRGWKSAAVFSSQQPWEYSQGKFFTEEFEKLGGRIVESVEPLPTTTTLHTEALKIVSAKPDVVFFSVIAQLGIASKELKKLRWNGPLSYWQTSTKSAGLNHLVRLMVPCSITSRCLLPSFLQNTKKDLNASLGQQPELRMIRYMFIQKLFKRLRHLISILSKERFWI